MDETLSSRVLVVLGMHRSGTSLMASLVPFLGVNLGERLLPPQTDNPEGFYEDIDVVALNTALLQAEGGDWLSLDWYPNVLSGPSFQQHCAQIISGVHALTQARTKSLRHWAFKDPRTLRTLPVWVDALDSLRIEGQFLVIVRRPEDVCASLARRDSMPEEHGLLLWLLYYLEQWPLLRRQRFSVIDYDALLSAPMEVMDRISTELGLPLVADAQVDVQRLVKRDLNHAKDPSKRPPDSRGKSIHQFAETVYRNFLRLQENCHDEEALSNLSFFAEELKRSAPVLSASEGIRKSQFSSWMLDLDSVYDRLALVLSSAAQEKAGHQKAQRLLTNELVRLQQQQQHYAEVLLDLERAYRHSTSWRLTAPLRKIGALKNRLLDVLSLRRSGSGNNGKRTAEESNHRVSTATSVDYARWIEHFEDLESSRLACEAEMAQNSSAMPLISVVLPTYKTPIQWLRRAIESVLDQFYQRWELCIVDDASSDARLEALLRDFEKRDARIRIKFRKTNGHISMASNDALEMATGEIVTFLDHDDELAPNALFEIAHAFAIDDELQMVYSDEDMIDIHGLRYNPYFKSDLDRELLRAQNMVTHLVAYRRLRVLELGGFRKGFEGAQDYDLVLRYSENLPDKMICHIAKILYHWRAIEGSTASSGAAKPYAAAAGQRAVKEHLDRLGIDAKVVTAPGLPDGSTFQRVIYNLPAETSMVSIIIPSRDKGDLLLQCVRSILRSPPRMNYEIIIVNNLTKERCALDYLRYLRRTNPKIKILDFCMPFNFSQIVNFGVNNAQGDIICLLNNDTEVISPAWLDELVVLASRPEVGAVGAKLLYPDRTIQHAGVVLGISGTAGHLYKHFDESDYGPFGLLKLTRNCAAVTGACLVVRKSVYQEVGGFDEKNFPVAFNDVDFCLRLLAAGYRNVWTPYAELFHYESASRGYEDTPEKKARFAREAENLRGRWADILDADPYYNINLTRKREDGSFAP